MRPNDNYNLDDGHVIPALINKCYLSKKNNEPFIVCGSGNPLRQFIYSEDLAKLILWVLEEYKQKENIILSVSEKDEISIKDISILISKKFNYDNIIFDKSKADGQYKKTADNTKLISLIKDFKFTNIEDGLSKSIDWFIENYDKCRK